MREWQRTTRECRFDELPPDIGQAMHKYFEKNELGSPESGILICCETVSTSLKKSFLGKLFGSASLIQHTGILVSPERVSWCVSDGKNSPVVASAQLSEIKIKDYDSKLIEDSGIEVLGFINQSSKHVQAFIGLGEEEAAQKIRRILNEAVEKARK